jgi:hypothetical protein
MTKKSVDLDRFFLQPAKLHFIFEYSKFYYDILPDRNKKAGL